MVEIRWHGRGGQGAVTSVEMFALAAIEEGKFAQGFPSFGPERRGAPVAAFNRVDTKRIKVRSGIYQPDVVVVLDPSLMGTVNVIDGLKEDGILIVNTADSPDGIRKRTGFKGTIATVDAGHIAREELGVPITNTTMLGALMRATNLVKMESAEEPLKERFGRLAPRNVKAMARAYKELKISKAA
ncbi:MAG: 2-oxoacid:acceptor oxidoreductase family protein [Syntrophales bacterium]|nr:2-oxoacid:acceptor oxidoreductase family protein [Syntrophales bacterium]MCK9528305.1 2-oxoacid:acceptor oxidoreductase family protein [Syntrophales bacterium]MDX9922144.1 2-oxoacid:acceptor oxidoreductase family protein [Syntrophales bacterium]